MTTTHGDGVAANVKQGDSRASICGGVQVDVVFHDRRRPGGG